MSSNHYSMSYFARNGSACLEQEYLDELPITRKTITDLPVTACTPFIKAIWHDRRTIEPIPWISQAKQMISGFALSKTYQGQSNKYGFIISGLREKRIPQPTLDLSVTRRESEHLLEFPFQIRPQNPFSHRFRGICSNFQSLSGERFKKVDKSQPVVKIWARHLMQSLKHLDL
jgi:hypothetical protein